MIDGLFVTERLPGLREKISDMRDYCYQINVMTLRTCYNDKGFRAYMIDKYNDNFSEFSRKSFLLWVRTLLLDKKLNEYYDEYKDAGSIPPRWYMANVSTFNFNNSIHKSILRRKLRYNL